MKFSSAQSVTDDWSTLIQVMVCVVRHDGVEAIIIVNEKYQVV